MDECYRWMLSMMIDVFSACVKVVCKMCSKALNVVLNCEKNVKKCENFNILQQATSLNPQK